jgi:hypothetical protein
MPADSQLNSSSSGSVSEKCDGTAYEMDGAFKCWKCGATWGAITNPDRKTHTNDRCSNPNCKICP